VGLNFELVFITGVQVQPQLVFLDTIIEIRRLLRWHSVFGRTMAGQRDPSISYDICVRSIEYISNEQAILKAFRNTPRCCFLLEGWASYFSKSRFLQNSSIEARRVCQYCPNTFINPDAEVRLLQIRREKPNEDLSALVTIAYLIHITSLLLSDAINSSLIPLSYLLLLDEINSIQTRRRPPPRSRRRSCANVNNPRPQPSILSENLSRFAVSVCQSSRPLAF
jgi:hypothetical protein